MKKLIIAAIAAVAMSAFADANDPLIPADVVKGATYELQLNGKTLTTYVSNDTGKVNFQGVASLSADPTDYDVVMTAAPEMMAAAEVDPELSYPTAIAERQAENTVFESDADLTLLRKPKLLEFPVANEVDYIFDVAETEELRAFIAKVVANEALLNAMLTGSDISDYIKDWEDEDVNYLVDNLVPWAEKVAPFFGWNADFEVSFDRDVEAGTIVLDGQYDESAQYGYNSWVGSTFDEKLEAGRIFRLLKEGYTKPIYLNFQEICTRILRFRCGAFNLSPDNWGTTMTVKLCIYENTGRDNETGTRIEIGTYTYTFGHLTINFSDGPNVPEGAKNPAKVDIDYEGKTMYELPLPTYEAADKAFAGWAKEDGTVLKAIPAKTFGTFDLYSTWTSAQKIEVEAGEESAPVEIKVTEKWITENVKTEGEPDPTTEKIQEVLNTTDENGNKKWENYVAGIDPTAQVAGLAEQNDEEKTVKVVAQNITPPTVDTGFKVSYSLDEVTADKDGMVVDEGQPTTSDNLDIDLDKVEEHAYFKVNVIIEKEDGTGAATKIAAENTLGVLKVNEAPATSIISVPWKDVGGEDVTVDKLVKTATLTPDDKLYVYNQDGSEYTTWTLDENGEWKTTGEDESVQASETKVPRGSAVWLTRADKSKPVVLFGQADSRKVEVTLDEKPAESDKSWNIVAAPTVDPVNLNVQFNEETKENVENDQIIVPTDGAPKNYTFKDGKWGYTEVEQIPGTTRVRSVRKTDATVPAGVGFWYLNGGDKAKVEW